MPESTPKSKRRTRRTRRELTPEDRAARVLRDLRALAYDLARAHGFGPHDELPIEELVLPVALALERVPKRSGGLAPGRALVEQLASRLEEALRAQASFRLGRVYCFQSGSLDVPHAAPRDPAETFAGYTATGKPTWQSFVNLLLARGDPRVDQLWSEPPNVVAVTQLGTELTDDLLPGFGRDDLAFNVMGQVVAGLIPADLRPRSTALRVALTIQLVETRQGNVPLRVRLNLLGLTREAIVRAASEQPRGPADRFRESLGVARDRGDALGRRLVRAERRGERLDVQADVSALLEDLRRDVERAFRPHRHRTRHAQEHHVEGERPIASALRDARQASHERVLFDTRRETFVVLGKRGRAHVFSPDGRHVTSLQLQPGEVERKSNKGRWGPVKRADYEAFLRTLEGA